MRFINRWWSAFDRLALAPKRRQKRTCDSEQETVDYCKSFRTQIPRASCWIWKGLSSCVCHLYYLRQQWSQVSPCNRTSIVLKCFSRYSLSVCQQIFFSPFLRQLVELARIQFSPSAMSLGNLFSTWSCVMRCFYAVENGLVRGATGEEKVETWQPRKTMFNEMSNDVFGWSDNALINFAHSRHVQDVDWKKLLLFRKTVFGEYRIPSYRAGYKWRKICVSVRYLI